MSRRIGFRLTVIAVALALLAGVVELIVWPVWAPWVVAMALVSGVYPLALAWRASRSTALRPAVAWAAGSLGVGLVGQIVAAGEPLATGRPWSGHLTYLACLASLAALTTVLNARRPGGGAWAILMGLLVLVFLIPWLEGSGLGRRGSPLARLRLEMPWSLFFGLIAATGVTNYLPTRAGPAALAAGLGLLLEGTALVRPDWPPVVRGRIWSVVPFCLAASLWLALVTSRRLPRSRPGLERLWLWFRDAWGVAWALRVQERFNRAAETSRWPIRLSWTRLDSLDPPIPEPAAALPTFQALLRRFADPDRLERASGPPPPP